MFGNIDKLNEKNLREKKMLKKMKKKNVKR